MESINTTAFTGASARLFQQVKVAGESLTDANRTGGSPTSQLSDSALRNQSATLQPDAVLETPPARPPKQASNSPDQAGPNAAAFRFQRSGDASLFLTTQQGDTVQIKIKNQVSATLASNEFQSGDTLVSQFGLESSESSKVSFVINGDLNADEMRAIGGVLEQVSAIAQDFFNGKVNDAFATAERFNMDGAQLANAAVDMNFQETLTYSSLVKPALPALSPATPVERAAPASDAAPSGVNPSPLAPAPADDTPPSGPAQLEAEVGLPGAHADAHSAHAQGIHQALDTIDGFLKGLVDRLKRPLPSDKAGEPPAAGFALKLKLFQSVITTAAEGIAQTDATRTPLPALVGDTLDALSAKQEPPLNAVV